MTMKPTTSGKETDFKYFLIRQSNGEKKRAVSIAKVANYLDSTPFMIKLHLDKPVNLKGWEIKSIS